MSQTRQSQDASSQRPLTPGAPESGLNRSRLMPRPQSWHEYSESIGSWGSVPSADEASLPKDLAPQINGDPRLVIATWNVNYLGPQPQARLNAIFSHTTNHAPSPDIIFFQEVSRPAVGSFLRNEEVRKGWYSSERDTTNWRGAFATMVLLSKARFGPIGKAGSAILGRVSRIRYPSRMNRDALCSEVFVPAKRTDRQQPVYAKLLLINVHLESTNQPECCEYRADQLAVAGSILRDTGRGLVAGDFNPVDLGDEGIIEGNGLRDAWKGLRGQEPGYTWGVDRKAKYPACRMDKVAALGLKPCHIEVMHPREIFVPGLPVLASEPTRTAPEDRLAEKKIPWSDHSGLKCTFTLI